MTPAVVSKVPELASGHQEQSAVEYDAPFRVLVVDDDHGTRDVLETALSKQGYAVTVAASGREALRYVDSERFDLVIADVRMPEPNGITLLASVQERAPETVVVLMTGYATMDVAIRAIRQGAYDFLAKPFHIDELYLVVRNAIERTMLIQENRRLLHELQRTYRTVDEILMNRKERPESDSSDLENLQALHQQVLRLYANATAIQRPPSARQYGRYRPSGG